MAGAEPWKPTSRLRLAHQLLRACRGGRHREWPQAGCFYHHKGVADLVPSWDGSIRLAKPAKISRSCASWLASKRLPHA